MSNIYVHNLDPFIIQFTESIGLRWYSMAYLVGFFIGYMAVIYMAKRKTLELTPEEIADFAVYVALGTLLGGRIGYALFYSPDLLTEFSSEPPFWGVLKVYEGGMASHGGIIGIIVATWLYVRKNKKNFLHLVDLSCWGGALGIFLGRIANFINGELYGREAPEGYKWAVKFPQEMYLWTQKSVGKLFDVGPAAQALGEISTKSGEKLQITADLWRGWVTNYREYDAHVLVNSIIEKLILAVQQGNQAVTEALAPALTARYPSQLYQAVGEGLIVLIVLSIIWLKPRKPGVIAGWFGILYSIARIIGEQYRMPDAQIGFQLLGLTRGQWLSIGFLAFAIGWMVYASKRNVKPLGGWGLNQSQNK